MKKIASYLTIASILFVASSSMVSAQTTSVPASVPATPGQNYEDAETLAQAFLLHNTDHYIAQLWSYNQSSGTSYSLNMVLDNNLFITNMTVNSTNIPLPQPLGGIPVPASGYQNVQIQITAVDKYGNTASTGQLITNYLGQGSLVSISMAPQFPPTAIQLQQGLDPNTIAVNLTGVNGWGWSYDPSTGLLTISVFDQTTTDIGYTVTDGSGGLLAHGSLPFFQQIPGAGTGTNSVFDLHNAGGVLVLPLGTNGYNYGNNLPFDSTVTRNGQVVPTKVIGVPDVSNQSKLYINAYNLNGGTIEVRQWSATGTMTLIPCSVTTDAYGDTTMITSEYVDKAVITVLPAQGQTNSTFNLYVSRTY